MSNLSDTVRKLRAEYCEGCREQFNREEIIEEDKCCSGCEKAREVGKTVATLKD